MIEHHLVDHNAWDVLADLRPPTPTVSVVVVHYDQEASLRRVLVALDQQDLPPIEVVVSDDGSRTPPRLPPTDVPVRLVTQEDRGFRAAAARNRGAAACSGEVLVFLDADSIPGPTTVRALVRTAALCPDVLAVGRRRHVDLRHVAPDSPPWSAPHLDDPVWLVDGYRRSSNLLHADGRSFRFVISAILACQRSLFDDLGGFDESFVGYGGEDWDLAYRAWNAGAVLVHEPSAVVWHDGPDWAGRGGGLEAHDDQTLRMAAMIPEPATRGAALPHTFPDLLVDIEPSSSSTADQVRVIHSVLRQTFADLAVRTDAPLPPAAAALYGPTVRTVPWSVQQRARARAQLTVHGPLPAAAVARAMATLVDGDLGEVEVRCAGTPAGTLRSTRLVGRARRWRDHRSASDVVASLGRADIDVGPPSPPGATLEGHLAGW